MDRPDSVRLGNYLYDCDQRGTLSDEAALRNWIEQVIDEHSSEAARCARGERKLLGVLVGFVMKKSQGRADPKRVNQLLAERLGA